MFQQRAWHCVMDFWDRKEMSTEHCIDQPGVSTVGLVLHHQKWGLQPVSTQLDQELSANNEILDDTWGLNTLKYWQIMGDQ